MKPTGIKSFNHIHNKQLYYAFKGITSEGAHFTLPTFFPTPTQTTVLIVRSVNPEDGAITSFTLRNDIKCQ